MSKQDRHTMFRAVANSVSPQPPGSPNARTTIPYISYRDDPAGVKSVGLEFTLDEWNSFLKAANECVINPGDTHIDLNADREKKSIRVSSRRR